MARKNDPRAFKWKSNALVAALTLSSANAGAAVLVWREDTGAFRITLGGTDAQRSRAVCTVTAAVEVE